MDNYNDDYIEDSDMEDLPRTEFVNKIENYYATIMKYKDEHKNEDGYWKDEYDNIVKQFEELLNIAEYNWMDAKQMIENIECFKFDNFQQYIYNHDIRNTKHIKGTDIRPKTIRRKRSNLCPRCKIECKPTKEMDTLKCPNCGYEIMKNKAGVPDNVINGEKHIRKHYDKLIGCSKIPASLSKILPYLTIWLTEWKHIRDWLVFSNRFDNFVFRYQQRSGKLLHYENFDVVLQRDDSNRMPFDVYELFTEEFYKMTELMSKTNKKTSNVIGTDEFIMELVGYAMQTVYKQPLIYSFKDIADETTTVIYNGIEYNVGIYFNKLSLVYDYDEHHIKYKLVNKYCFNKVDCLVFPGLMFNFNELFTTSQNIPKSFIYAENYNKIMYEVFHSTFAIISNSDIKILIQLHLKFNEYYKQHVQKTGKKKNTKTNSPLFVVVFKCIVSTFKHFHKYIPVLNHIPHRITESITKNEIDNLWLQFMSLPENKELYDLYDNDMDENETNDDMKPTANTLNKQEEPTDDKDFINYYDDDDINQLL